jgi:hypothetical protein
VVFVAALLDHRLPMLSSLRDGRIFPMTGVRLDGGGGNRWFRDMKTRLKRIDPGGLGGCMGVLGFVMSIPGVILSMVMAAPGASIKLTGFFSFGYSSPQGSPSALMLLGYPVMNTVGGVITGFLVAWFYNFFATSFGGVAVELEAEGASVRRRPSQRPLGNRPE